MYWIIVLVLVSLYISHLLALEWGYNNIVDCIEGSYNEIIDSQKYKQELKEEVIKRKKSGNFIIDDTDEFGNILPQYKKPKGPYVRAHEKGLL